MTAVGAAKRLQQKSEFGKPMQLAVDLDSTWSGEPALAKILVVDDDAAVQMTIRLLLERAGHSVVVASDGRKGLSAFEEGSFDLLFLDIFMPGMDGLETMRLVHQRRPDIPIIVISGRPIDAGAGRGTRLPDHGHQAGRGLQPAKALQAVGLAGDGCGLS